MKITNLLLGLAIVAGISTSSISSYANSHEKGHMHDKSDKSKMHHDCEGKKGKMLEECKAHHKKDKHHKKKHH